MKPSPAPPRTARLHRRRPLQAGVAEVLAAVGRAGAALGLSALACIALSGCAPLQMYKTEIPRPGQAAPCSAPGAPSPTAASVPSCVDQATERNDLYTLHIVEFDDEGWPFANPSGESSQIDSAIDQIKEQLRSSDDCVRLFVYVHGWRHNTSPTDSNLARFRELLGDISTRSRASTGDPCEDQTIAASRARAGPDESRAASAARSAPRQARTVGIYVGWRGLSIENVKPFVYASFWDRKNTAERVSQGSVRELFGRLSGLASYAPATDARRSAPRQAAQRQAAPREAAPREAAPREAAPRQAAPGQPAPGPSAETPSSARLRTYVIGHSFGASIAFRALSQSLINSFAEDLESDESADLASVSRFVDMLVLVNPAIEAARFDPVFRAAQKRTAYCRRNAGLDARCDQPPYQAPVLAIFTSEGDQATKIAFPLGASLSTTFERTVNEAQRRSIVETIGWDDDYKTHRLGLMPACSPADAFPYADSAAGLLRYRAPGWAWCFQEPGLPSPLAIRSEANTPYNGPLWNVRVAKEVMKDHGDIWNDVFRAVLLRLFTDQRGHPLGGAG